MRTPAIHHCTSEPLHFFGRRGELAMLDESLAGGPASVVAFVGPGGQGKTAIVQHWLRSRAETVAAVDGCFLWSFYRGKESGPVPARAVRIRRGVAVAAGRVSKFLRRSLAASLEK